MASNTTLNPGAGGDVIATDEIGGVKYEVVKVAFGAAGAVTFVDAANGLPVIVTGSALPTGAATSALQTTGNASLAAIDAKLGAPLTVNLGLTDAQLRAAPVPISGTVTANTGGLTDVQLRATPVPVSGPITDVQLRATPVPVSGPLTDVQLRATAVPISAVNLDVLLSTRLKSADTLAAVTSLTQFNGVAIALNTGVRSAGTLRVTIATDDLVPVSLPALPAGTNNIGDVDLAAQAAISNNPVGSVSMGNSLGKAWAGATGNLVTTAVTADQVIVTYTVTAGKTFYLQGALITARLTTFAATATLFGACSIETPAATKKITLDAAGSGIVAPPIWIGWGGEPQPIAAGTVIRVVCTPGAVTSYTWKAALYGYEK